MYRDVLDHGLVEPDPMVGAGTGGIGKDSAAPLGGRVKRGDYPYRALAPMSPYPVGDWHDIAITEGMNNRCHSCQIPPPGGEAVATTMPPRCMSGHSRALFWVTGPLLDELAQGHDALPAVILRQQCGQIRSSQHGSLSVTGRARSVVISAGAEPRHGPEQTGHRHNATPSHMTRPKGDSSGGTQRAGLTQGRLGAVRPVDLRARDPRPRWLGATALNLLHPEPRSAT